MLPPTEKCIFLQKNSFSYRKMHFPAEKCLFLQKCGSRAARRGKPQEIAGRLQGSRIKNASQLSQEKWWNVIWGDYMAPGENTKDPLEKIQNMQLRRLPRVPISVLCHE